ncbi:MAG: hypothetical protein QOG54_1192 [Actinomycetota bacterium]|jgi:hypothetical protein|nr:hypothetical protein [Actinomycetota bacterium]
MNAPLEIGLELLDKQILDVQDFPCGKVDDLELVLGDDGRGPIVTAIFTSPEALGRRLGGIVGRSMVTVWRRLHPNKDPHSNRIEWSDVEKIDYALHLNVGRTVAGLVLSESWARKFIERIPGA